MSDRRQRHPDAWASAQALRERAEEVVRQQAAHSPEGEAARSPAETERMLHELRVHQIELEMQNEELREAQLQLEAGRARDFDLYDLAPVGYLTVSERGLILEANLHAARLLGVARRALVNRRLSEFIVEEDQDLYYLRRKAILESREPGSFELRMVDSGGARHCAHLAGAAVEDEDGATVLRFVLTDITERKQTDERHRIEQRQELALAGANLGLWEWQLLEGTAVFDTRCCSMLGHRIGDLEDRIEAWRCRLHPEDGAAVEALLAAHLRSETPAFEAEFRMRHKKGHWVWILALGKVVERDAAGAPLRMAGTHLDITERKLVQAQGEVERGVLALLAHGDPLPEVLTHLVRSYEGLFQGMQGSALLLDASGRHLRHAAAPSLPPAFCAAIDGVEIGPGVGSCGTSAYTGQTVAVADIAHDPLWRDFKDLALAHGLHACWSMPLRGAAGRVLGTFAFYFDAPREALPSDLAILERGAQLASLAVERHRQEETNAKLQGQLQQAVNLQSVGRLAGGVAHDFNNMLLVILGHAEAALGHVDPAQSIHADLVEIRDAAMRSANLTRQLLTFARQQTVAPTVLDLNRTVTDMLKMLPRLLGEDVRLTWKPALALWPIKMDPSQVEQILTNLCVNARDAIADVGTITIETANRTIGAEYCADHADAVPGEYVELTVRDDGRGMASEVLAQIFEPFFTTKGVGKGTGLGLATVYGAVTQNHGFLDVSTSPSQGSAFAIYLPRYVSASLSPPAEAEAATATAPRGGETILLVEDEPAILRVTARLLESQGYAVLQASSASAAMCVARDHADEIQLLLTDVVMPGMNGRDLASALQSLHPHLKRMFMSGYPADVIAHRGVLGEGVWFIQKPFTKNALAAKVREALDSQPPS